MRKQQGTGVHEHRHLHRVSTDGQDATNQVLELRQWAESKCHIVVAEFQDVASGGRRREQLDDLFDAARHRKFELVATWSLDRLNREGPLQTLLYLQRLNYIFSSTILDLSSRRCCWNDNFIDPA